MLLVGQSLQFRRGALASAFARDDRAAVAAAARAQVEAGAQALDLNFGIDPPPDEIPWATAAVRAACPGVPLWLDVGRTSTLAAAVEVCARQGIAGPLVANSLPAGEGGIRPAEERLVRAAANGGAGIVISPRGVERGPSADGDVERVAAVTAEAVESALALGLRPPFFFDALVYPALKDPNGVRRSLALLRACRGGPNMIPLAAVGNISFGAPRSLAGALRAVYAAAATGAGAGALILGVTDDACVRAVRLALGEVAPASVDEAWLCEAAACASRDDVPPPAPEAYRDAAHLIFHAGLARAS